MSRNNPETSITIMEETNKDKPIVIKLKLQGGVNSVIPKGITEKLVITCRNESASFHFDDSKTTRKFVMSQNKDGVKTIYLERFQTAISSYPNMDKKQIYEHITKRLKELSKK